MARYYYKTTQSISKTVSFRHEYVCEKCGDTVSGIQNELLSSHEYKWIVNSKSDRFYKVLDLLNSAGENYKGGYC